MLKGRFLILIYYSKSSFMQSTNIVIQLRTITMTHPNRRKIIELGKYKINISWVNLSFSNFY